MPRHLGSSVRIAVPQEAHSKGNLGVATGIDSPEVRLGIHTSIAGGMAKMAEVARELGCQAVQIFSRSPRGGKAKALSPPDVEKMKSIFKNSDIRPLVVHAPYFVNLASRDPKKRDYSIETLILDLERADVLGAQFVVTHVGTHASDEPPESADAVERVSSAIEKVLGRYRGGVRILLENASGQGGELGASFDTIGELTGRFSFYRVGACLDTAHAYGAGYDLRGTEGVARVLDQFHGSVGLERLAVLHLNDTQVGLGSRKDRHAHLGKGQLGDETFIALARTSMLAPDTPLLLETPTDQDGDDRSNMERARSLLVHPSDR